MEDIASHLSSIGAYKTLIFGSCLLFGVLGGILANRIRWMPTITAFMILGFLIGPDVLNFISKDVLKESKVVIDIALGLILYDLGTMLHPKAMFKSKRLATISIIESSLCYVLVFAIVVLFGKSYVVAGLIAAIAVSSSPAVLVHVVEEFRAKGPISDRAKSLVAINNILAFLLFSMALPFGMSKTDQSLWTVIGLPMYRLGMAVIVGLIVAYAATRIARMLRKGDEHYRFAIVIGAVMLTIGICSVLEASALFAPLILGIGTRWLETRQHNLSKVSLGEGGDLFFIVLFVLAGAKIDFGSLIAVGWLAMGIVVLRCFAKTIGIFIGGKMNGIENKASLATSYMLIPMAGMAIGLVQTTTMFATDISHEIETIIFAMVAVFETVGPFLVTHALRMTGEITLDRGADDESSGGQGNAVSGAPTGGK